MISQRVKLSGFYDQTLFFSPFIRYNYDKKNKNIFLIKDISFF